MQLIAFGVATAKVAQAASIGEFAAGVQHATIVECDNIPRLQAEPQLQLGVAGHLGPAAKRGIRLLDLVKWKVEGPPLPESGTNLGDGARLEGA